MLADVVPILQQEESKECICCCHLVCCVVAQSKIKHAICVPMEQKQQYRDGRNLISLRDLLCGVTKVPTHEIVEAGLHLFDTIDSYCGPNQMFISK